MADQLNQGDEYIKNAATAGNEGSVSEKAQDNFYKELFSERERASSSSSGRDSNSVVNAEGITHSTTSKPDGSHATPGSNAADAIGITHASDGTHQNGSHATPGSNAADAIGITHASDGANQNGSHADASGLGSIISGAIDAKQKPNTAETSGIPEAISNAVREGKLNPSNPKDMAEAAQKIGDSLKQNDKVENIKQSLEDIFKKPDGVKKLPTGDYLVREDGKESLFTPNGDRVTVNPDGTHTIKGNVKSVESDKTGATTVTFADGAKVTIDKEGIRDVQRGNQAISFPRWNHINEGGHGGGGGGGGGSHGGWGGGGGGGGGSDMPHPPKPPMDDNKPKPDLHPWEKPIPNKIPDNSTPNNYDSWKKNVLPKLEIKKS